MHHVIGTVVHTLPCILYNSRLAAVEAVNLEIEAELLRYIGRIAHRPLRDLDSARAQPKLQDRVVLLEPPGQRICHLLI